MTLLAIFFILRILPAQSLPTPKFNYLAVLRSLGQLWKSEPQVRGATLTQAMLFASFSVLWTVLPFWLAHRYDYGAGITGTGCFGVNRYSVCASGGKFQRSSGTIPNGCFGVILMLLARLFLEMEQYCGYGGGHSTTGCG